jgi:hypothetical protein
MVKERGEEVEERRVFRGRTGSGHVMWSCGAFLSQAGLYAWCLTWSLE